MRRPERALALVAGLPLALGLCLLVDFPSLLGPSLPLGLPGFVRVARAASDGVIQGQVFTAEDPDSIAAGAALTLIYRGNDGALERLEGTSGPDGGFRFQGLSTDSSMAYVVKVEYRGNEFLGTPVQFATGESSLEFNILVSTVRALDPALLEGGMPPGHPGFPGTTPAAGKPVRPDPFLTLVVTLALLALLAAPVWLLARRDRKRDRGRLLGSARPLLLEVALLDERFAAGSVEEEEYRRRRAGLLEEIRRRAGRAAEAGEARASRPVLRSLSPERVDHAG